jgi:hypothetical protein
MFGKFNAPVGCTAHSDKAALMNNIELPSITGPAQQKW